MDHLQRSTAQPRSTSSPTAAWSIQSAWTRCSATATRANGWRRAWWATAAYPFPYIVAAGGRSVDGVLIMDLTAYDIQALDRYEEVDKGIYERRPVEVEVWGCGPRTMHLQAQTYVAGPALVASTSG